MAYGIDSQINERVDTYSSDPQKLMQRYTQSQSLLDLLALQKLKSEKEAAMRNMQTQMQPPMNTVRDQREQQVLDMTRNEVAQQAMQGGQQLALNKQREMQARGLPAQAAPNMQGMAMGGIVGLQTGGTGEDKMRELGIDPDYNIFTGALDAFGNAVKSAGTAIPEFLGKYMPGGGSVGEARMAEREMADAVATAYPEESAGTQRAIAEVMMAQGEEPPPPAVDTDRVRAEQYMGSDQQVDDMMSDIYRGVEPEAPAPKGDGLAGLAQAMTPSRLQELRNRREGIMGGITSPERLQRDKLRAYVSGLGQTGLGGGAEAFTREQQRQDALQIGDLDRLIELEREDEKLQREINASMAEVVANNEAELAQLLMNTSLKDRLEQAGDRRGFISDVLKQVQKDSIMNPALMALEEAKKDGDITRDAYETQRLSIIMDMLSGLPAGYDIETGLGGSVDFTQGTFD